MSDELDTIVAADNDKYMIRCENLVKIYKTSDVEVVALQGLDLDVERGELMAIVGNSGSGKSTLLNMLGGLDKPSAGNLYVDGKDLLKFTDKDYMEYKRNTVGFVWQNNARNLVPYLTAVQNVELPMLLNGEHKRRQKALELLDRVGLLKEKTAGSTRCREANSKELQLLLHWQTIRDYCWLMNLQARWIQRLPI